MLRGPGPSSPGCLGVFVLKWYKPDNCERLPWIIQENNYEQEILENFESIFENVDKC